MRLMTHFNIGATLATAVWVLWSGALVVAGQVVPGHPPGKAAQEGRSHAAGAEAPMRLTPMTGAPVAAMSHCHATDEPPGTGARLPSGADL